MRFRTSLIVITLASAAAFAYAVPRQDEPAAQTFHPGKQHELLASLVGDWDAATRFTFAPNAPPSAGKHTARVDALLDGRFVRLKETFDMMGAPSEAEKTFGYNAEANRFEGVWIYSGSTALMSMHGAFDEKKRTIAMDAAFASADADSKFKVTVVIESPDRFVVTLMSDPTNPLPGATFETTYTRSKSKTAK